MRLPRLAPRLPSTKTLLTLLKMYRRVLPWALHKAIDELESPEDYAIFLSMVKPKMRKLSATIARLEKLKEGKLQNLVGE